VCASSASEIRLKAFVGRFGGVIVGQSVLAFRTPASQSEWLEEKQAEHLPQANGLGRAPAGEAPFLTAVVVIPNPLDLCRTLFARTLGRVTLTLSL
jgi:hypothetical protein